MTISELISLLDHPLVTGPVDVEITGISADSRHANNHIMFAAVMGEKNDGNAFVPQALANGVTVILSEKGAFETLKPNQTWIQVKDSRKSLALLAVVFQKNPAASMKMCGVTGTNGKTTTTFLVHHVMKSVWHRAGMLGTVSIHDGERYEEANSTTPGPVELQSILRRMADHACRGVAMEVSSHGIDQHRVTGIGYDACIFTNLTQDHLDYHNTIENYFNAKKSWFDRLAADPLGKKPIAIINIDDSYGTQLIKSIKGKMRCTTFGFGALCDFRINNLKQNAKGMEFELSAKGKNYLVRAPFIGRFNAYNITGAIAAVNSCGISMRDAANQMLEAPQIPGRMENVGSAAGAVVFVDYAHTPDALENACRTLRELNPRRLITIFGCGGDRDRTKRPLMARAAEQYSDFCVVTSDNPRTENPDDIIKEIVAGMTTNSHVTITDRAEAIAKTIEASRTGDIILLAGKGHENYQQFAEKTIHFDDKNHAVIALKKRTVEAKKFIESIPEKPRRKPRA
jgi:UDP-N-acetylmuramoyl-L-alanyl-D-glutamate--2,6-diaminopimelate ligase